MTQETVLKPSRVRPWLCMIGFFFFGFGGLGTILAGTSPFVPAVVGELGFTASAFTSWLTFYAIGTAIAMPLVGRVLPKYDTRIIFGVCVTITLCAYGLMSQYSHLWQWYISGLVIGIAGGFFFIVPAPVILSNWFVKWRGIAIAMAMAGIGMGGVVMAPVGNLLIDTVGWRSTYLLEAVISFVVIMPWALFVIRFKPSQCGLLPYGLSKDPSEFIDERAGVASDEVPGYTAKQALRTLSFWCVLLAGGLVTMFGSYASYYSMYTTSIGLGPMAGSMMVSAANFGVVCNPLIGLANDKLGPRITTLTMLTMVVVGFAGILFTGSSSIVLLVVFAFIAGFQGRVVAIETPLILQTIFGLKDLSKTYSYVQLISGLSMAIAFPVVGLPYDLTGTFAASFIFGIVLAVVVGALVVVAFLSGKRIIADWKQGSVIS